ncbi:hypothetical protein GCM10023069_18730 [Shinella granuli]
MGLRLPYANLRTHRKNLVVDGSVAFTGGLNNRAGFCAEFSGEAAALDTHFRLTGPVVSDLFRIVPTRTGCAFFPAARDELSGEAWQIRRAAGCAGKRHACPRRAVGRPDKSLETNHRMLMGAVSVAKRHILIMSPYFLPDRELISAIVTAARRGVEIDIVVPSSNNLKLVDLAMTAQFDQMLKHGCRIWRASGAFNHSKLTVIDGAWSYIGSSNIDPRSLRLNFEVDIEVIDAGFARSHRPAHRHRVCPRPRRSRSRTSGHVPSPAPRRAHHMARLTLSVGPNERSQTTLRSICALIGR